MAKKIKTRSKSFKGLPKELTQPTVLSKIIAFIAFIILPLAAFFIGLRYQEWYDINTEGLVNSQPIIIQQSQTISLTPTQSPIYYGVPQKAKAGY